MNGSRPGTFVEVSSDANCQRPHGVARENRFDLVHHVVGVLGTRAFQQEDRSFIARADQFLQRQDRHENARAFAVLDDRPRFSNRD